MTFYIRHKKTGEDFILKSVDIPKGVAKVVLNFGNPDPVQWPLKDIIESYDFRYDIF